MVRMRWTRLVVALAVGLGGAGEARAAFHLMQIEQVLGGFCGDPSLQAVQLRMRSPGQSVVSLSRLRFHDEQGLDPQTLVDLMASVPNGAAGSRVLVATAAFASRFGITPDATISTPIPTSLLGAGRLTFEADLATVYWSLSWGGNGYTGPNNGSTLNDPDGDFGPPYPGALPFSSGRALLFGGTAAAASSTNAADYALSAGDATFTNNAGTSVVLGGCVFGDGFESGGLSSWTSSSP